MLRPKLTRYARTVRDTLGTDIGALSDSIRTARNHALDALSQEVPDLSRPAVAHVRGCPEGPG